MTHDEAIKWLSDELMFLERPNVNKGSGLEKKIAVCRMAIDAIREQEERRWIPVTERLPECGKRVLATEARLIDADKRIQEIKKIYCTGCDNYGGAKCRACWVDDAMCLIDDAATVEVVRCKDCQHSKLPAVLTQKYGEPGTLTCHNWHGPCNKRNVNQDDFCSYGERKDGDK